MKRILAILLLALCGCSEKEQPLDSKLFGTWVSAYFAEDLGFESVNRYVFLPDGTYSYEWGYRILGEPELAGYHNIWNGNYLTSGDQLTLQTFRIFAPPSHVTSPPFVPKDQLLEIALSPVETNRFQYHIASNPSTLTIRTPQSGNEGATFQKVD
jgi:hypothetical protein